MLISLLVLISHLLVFVGLYGAFTARHNLVITLISLEMSLLGASLLLLSASLVTDDFLGILFFFYLITLAGVESALSLAFVIVYYRVRTSVH